MPCSSEGYDTANRISQQEELDKVTRMLCYVLKQVERAPISGHIHIDQETTDWWKVHKKLDAARAASRAEARRQDALRREALAKLSPAERQVLGLGKVK